MAGSSEGGQVPRDKEAGEFLDLLRNHLFFPRSVPSGTTSWTACHSKGQYGKEHNSISLQKSQCHSATLIFVLELLWFRMNIDTRAEI
jgi:hypothetical protein